MIDTHLLPDVDQIENSMQSNTGDSLFDVMYSAVLNLHHYPERDQRRICQCLKDNVSRLSSNDRLWIAKVFKNSYLSLGISVVGLYFELMYAIEGTLVNDDYDIKLLAELLEQFGRLFMTYPEKEKHRIVRIFSKYLVSDVPELVTASYESVMMAALDFDEEVKEILLSVVSENSIGHENAYGVLKHFLGADHENRIDNS